MTCIIGMIDNGKAYMGADRRISFGNIKRTMPTYGKIIERSGLLIGTTGYLKFNNLIRYDLLFNAQPKDMPDDVYVYKVIVEEIRKTAKDNGYMSIHDNEEKLPEMESLLIYNNKIYTVFGDLSICETEHKFWATGSGGDLAIGALSVLENSLDSEEFTYPPEYKIIKALEIAAKYDNSVGAPFDVHELGSKVFKTYKNSEEALSK